MSALLAPVPMPPFVVRASGRECFTGIADESRAAVLAFRMVRRGSSLADVTDATGWTCDIYAARASGETE